MGRLIALSAEIGCNGYYMFTLHPDEAIRVHGRMFAPAIGIPEDPVTGNANGPLGAYAAHYGLLEPQSADMLRFTAMQGEAIGRPGSMEVRITLQNGEPSLVQIVGCATVAFATTLLLDER
jgi:PhzF family phenazine biosynthesis protein